MTMTDHEALLHTQMPSVLASISIVAVAYIQPKHYVHHGPAKVRLCCTAGSIYPLYHAFLYNCAIIAVQCSYHFSMYLAGSQQANVGCWVPTQLLSVPAAVASASIFPTLNLNHFLLRCLYT